MDIPTLRERQQVFFNSQKTKEIAFRVKRLKKLRHAIVEREQDIYDALKEDFKKSHFETFISEYGLVISELDLVLKKLKSWSQPERVKSSILTFPSSDYIYKEPYGNVLAIAPWNYPFLLAIEPVFMAVAAGNTVVLKPSELTKHTSQMVTDIIETVFENEYVASIQGGIPVATELLEQNWDYIFFTGSVPVGKIVAKAAAQHLTPVTLELGGKSPCVVDNTMNLELAAKRIVWGKFFNGGQTCIAPDYLIAHDSIKAKLIDALQTEIKKAYGENPKLSEDFPRIINEKNTKRLIDLLEDVTIVFGGEHDLSKCYVAPTLVDSPDLKSKLMQDEIFGPILPIYSYSTESDIESIITHYEKPLSLYIFSKDDDFIEHIISKFSFGGGAINDPLIQYGNHRLPFGGIGSSGMGVHHGKHGFDTFTHRKSIIRRGTWFDPPLRYAPYKDKISLIKKMFKWFA